MSIATPRHDRAAVRDRRPAASVRAWSIDVAWPPLVFLGSALAVGFVLFAWMPSTFIDLRIYREAAGVVLAGRPLYGATFVRGLGFTYPPITAVLFTALRLGSLRADEIGVTVVNLALVALTGCCATRLRAERAERRWSARDGEAWLGAAIALWTMPVTTAIGYGQIDLLVAALVLVDLSAGRRAPWGGTLVGAAAALKLTPLVFVVYLAFARRPRMAARALGVFALSIAVELVALPGDARSYWTGAVLATSRVTGTRTGGGRGPSNQSLHAALLRLWPATAHLPGVWLAAGALVAVAGLALAVMAARRGDEVWGCLLTAVTGLLVCPVTWVHHGAIAVPGLLVIVCARRRSGPVRVLAAAAVVAASWAIRPVMSADPTGVHLGLLGLLSGDLYVIAGLATLVAGAVAQVSARAPTGPSRRVATAPGSSRSPVPRRSRGR